MSLSLMSIVTAAGAVGSAVAGGVYANFSLRIMPRLARVPETDGIATMQRFNRIALRPPFMTIFFGTAAASLVSIVSVVVRPERTVPGGIGAVGGGLYLAGFLLTIGYNVPRNEQLAKVSAGTPEGSPVWRRYLREWTPANSVRGVLSVLGAVGLGIGAVLRLASG